MNTCERKKRDKGIKQEREAEAMEGLSGHRMTLSFSAEHPDGDAQQPWTPPMGNGLLQLVEAWKQCDQISS